MVLRSGQGHDHVVIDDTGFDIAWYRESDASWHIWLSVSAPGAQTECSADTTFQCDTALATSENEALLAAQLADQLHSLIGQA